MIKQRLIDVFIVYHHFEMQIERDIFLKTIKKKKRKKDPEQMNKTNNKE